MNKKLFLIALCTCCAASMEAQTVSWPTVTVDAKPGSRWWWMGSAVDNDNLKWNLEQYAAAGLGTMEVTPIYGVQNNEKNELSYLTSSWMQALQYVQQQATANGMQIDMNNGTGWPFGGPTVTLADAAGQLAYVTDVVTGDGTSTVSMSVSGSGTLNKVMAYPQTGNTNEVTEVTSFVDGNTLKWVAPTGKWRIIAIRNSHTGQQVKRAAPGGEGYVLDHFNADAVQRYLERFDEAFTKTGVPYPKTFFNDSYEVYYADWTPNIFTEFEKYRGYKLENNMDKLLGYSTDTNNQVLADYRQTLQDMLLNNFTKPWTEWAHSHGALTRNQAHGSPADLLDLYAAVDIPEIEGFGLTDFNIRGLRKDPGFVRDNLSDFTTLKWASSAAHVMGKTLTSSETFTWLTEHFRTSLSQMKPDLDLMFCAGVNHMFFHGTTYSPKSAEWPGWKFYAAIDMSPTNSIWRDAPNLMKYIERCQSFLQMGKPDNDLLVYAPFVNAMHKNTGLFADKLLTFPIDNINNKLQNFKTAVTNINAAGYDCDYISDLQIESLTYEDGKLKTAAGQEYAGLIIPIETYMPETTLNHLNALKGKGAQIVTGYTADVVNTVSGMKKESARTDLGLNMIRRKNDTGYHYFISNLTHNDVNAYTTLGVNFANAVFFDPLTGGICDAKTNGNQILLNLKSGQSVIVETYDAANHADSVYQETYEETGKQLTGSWKLSFTDSYPSVTETLNLPSLQSWENLNDNTAQLMGTGVYEKTFSVDAQTMKQATAGFNVDLGDVRESARLYINDEYVGTAWSAPFVLRTHAIHEGENTIRVEVTNLPANRIRQMDADGKTWRIFEDVNILDVTSSGVGVSGVTSYADWAKVPSGLNSSVTLIPIHDAETIELKATLDYFKQDDINVNSYYPVYKLAITDGTKIEGSDEVEVTEDLGKYKTISVKDANGKSYETDVPAYGAYELKQQIDFTKASPKCGINTLTSRTMTGFVGTYSGAQAKQYATVATSDNFFDNLTMTSSNINFYFFFPGYGMNMSRDIDATLDAKAYDVAVVSAVQGSTGNASTYQASDSVNTCYTTLDDGNIDFILKSRNSNIIYRMINVFAPVKTPSAIVAIQKAETTTGNVNSYNLVGQRVAGNYKGIVIEKGKKVCRYR